MKAHERPERRSRGKGTYTLNETSVITTIGQRLASVFYICCRWPEDASISCSVLQEESHHRLSGDASGRGGRGSIIIIMIKTVVGGGLRRFDHILLPAVHLWRPLQTLHWGWEDKGDDYTILRSRCKLFSGGITPIHN